MTPLLALGAALLLGSGDFLAGSASRTRDPLWIAAGVSLVGAVAMLGTAWVMGTSLTPGEAGFGAAAGLASAAGVGMLYAALAKGPMGVVAPVSAVVAAAVPVIVGLATGDPWTMRAGVGTCVGLASVWMVSRRQVTGDARARLIAARNGALAGVGLGAFAVGLSATSSSHGAISLSRLVSAGALLVVIRVTRRPSTGGVALWRPVVLVGFVDWLAIMLYAAAFDGGELSIVAMLAALYPIPIAVLARVVHGELLLETQKVGIALAVVAATLLALP